MKNFATKFAVTAFAVATLAGPAFAASDESRTEDTLKVMHQVPGAVNQLSDTELAGVEGAQFPGAVAASLFGSAFLFALQGDFEAAANASVAGSLIGTQVPTP